MVALLAWWETIKKDNHGKDCNNQKKHFPQFVLSVDVMIGKLDLVVLVQLSQTMEKRRDEPIYHIRGWGNR